MPRDTRHVAVVARPWQEVTDFVRESANLPAWTHGPDPTSDEALDRDAATVLENLEGMRTVLDDAPAQRQRQERRQGALRSAPSTAETLPAAVRIRVAPEQEQSVPPVVQSLAGATVTPTAWPRLVLDGDEAVGFVMASSDPSGEELFGEVVGARDV